MAPTLHTLKYEFGVFLLLQIVVKQSVNEQIKSYKKEIAKMTVEKKSFVYVYMRSEAPRDGTLRVWSLVL